MIKYLLLIPLFFFNVTEYNAQSNKESNIWYFGYNAGIDFNTDSPTPLLDGQINIWEGCTTACDSNGVLLFYSDGRSIWNNNHEVIPNATSLGGDNSATQSGIIVKQPSNENVYYVFSVDDQGGSGGLQYAVVSKFDVGNNFELVSKNNRLLDRSAEKITTIPHCNTEDIWILAHSYGSNIFHKWLLTREGLEYNSNQPLGQIQQSSGLGTSAIGYLKASPNNKKLAMAVFNEHYIELFDFDNETGNLSNALHIEHNDLRKSYGLEFSPNGRFLYCAGTQTSPKILQIDLQTTNPTENIRLVGNGQTSYFGAIQNAPDGKIYIAKDNSPYLSIINNPNQYECSFVEDGFYLGGRESGIGLPNFVPSLFTQIPKIEIIEDVDDCTSASTLEVMLQHFNSENATFQWFLNDLLIDGETTSNLIATETGLYQVLVTNNISCGNASNTYEKEINITIKQAISIDNLVCTQPSCNQNNGSIELFVTGGSPPYLYSIDGGINYQEDSSFNSLTHGNYNLSVMDSNGCDLRIEVTLQDEESNLIDTITLVDASCGESNGSIIVDVLDEEEASYTINGIVYQSDNTFEMISSGNYTITVKSIEGCTDTMEVYLNNGGEIEIEEIEIKNTTCNKENGEIEIKSNSDNISIALDGGSFQQSNIFAGLSKSTYSITLINNEGCQIDTMITILNQDCPLIFPNIFSPNNDNNNDYFTFDFTGTNRIIKAVKIYDRWGNLVKFKSRESKQFLWDGTIDGQNAQTGVYTYIVTINDKGQQGNYNVIGDITLIR